MDYTLAPFSIYLYLSLVPLLSNDLSSQLLKLSFLSFYSANKRGMQSRGRRPEMHAMGKVTPPQIAYIVDRYLCDNYFVSTRSMFRNEASSLLSNSPVHEPPKTLLTLGEMLEEYICLKEQKVLMDQERVLMEQERNRVQSLLQGMQNVMNAYNANAYLPSPASTSAVVPVPQPTYINKSQPGVPTYVQSKMNTQLLPQSSNLNGEGGNSSTTMMVVSDRKRKDIQTLDAPSAGKKSRATLSSKNIPLQGQNVHRQPENNAVDNQVVAQPSSAIQSSPMHCVPSGLQGQGSSIARRLFNPSTHSVSTNPQVAKTPPRVTSSHSDAHISPSEISSSVICNHEVTPTRCTVISTKRVMVSPAKQMTYIEMSHCISPIKTGSDKVIKRDHVRSRLDFDSSDILKGLDKPMPSEALTSESEKELDLFDMDIPNFDGLDFAFSEMLNNLEVPCEGIDFQWNPTSSPMENDLGGSSQDCNNGSNVFSEFSTGTEVLYERDPRKQGADSTTAVKSVRETLQL